MTRPLRLAALLLAPSLGACASAPGAEGGAGASARGRPLAALSGAPGIAVVPTRYLWVLDLPPQVRRDELRDSTAVLAAFDAELRSALERRAVGADWIWPETVRRSVARSGGMMTDPANWNVRTLAAPTRGSSATVPETVRSQLRALGALHGARYVLYPLRLEVAAADGPFAASGGGAVHGRLRLALIDVRTAAVEWIGEVEGPPAASYSPILLAGVASRAADLVAPAR